MSCPHRPQTGASSIRRGLAWGEVKTVESKGSWSGQGYFLEEGALEMGLAFSSDIAASLSSMALAPW